MLLNFTSDDFWQHLNQQNMKYLSAVVADEVTHHIRGILLQRIYPDHHKAIIWIDPVDSH